MHPDSYLKIKDRAKDVIYEEGPEVCVAAAGEIGRGDRVRP
jgi:hypothetical protein